MKKINLFIIFLLLVVFISAGCTPKGDEDQVLKISPFNEYENTLLQLYLPNKNLSCIITEISGVSDFDDSNEIMEMLNFMKNRTSESRSFVQMEGINFLTASIVSDTAFIEYDVSEDLMMSEMEECLLLYSIINSVSNIKEVNLVKLSSSTGSKQFMKYYNIETPLAPTNTLLYRDYQSPLSPIENMMNSVMTRKEPNNPTEAEVSDIVYNTEFDIVDYTIKSYEYNKYGEYITVRTQVVFTDSSNNLITIVFDFLLELTGGRFKIKEIIK
ncbi:MAG: hypothetical protein JXQ26_03375 [Tissierellales bacterium]|nr:hypothetical protein [Tissierellales bacterium]MBN2827002.1 hypothetical protein [Tissierellales bacterium]